MNPVFAKAGADDILPVIVVVIFMVVRLAAFIQKGKEGKTQPARPPRPARRSPTTLEDFFRELSGEPVQPPKPEPAAFVRPDYLREMDEFDRLQMEEPEEEAMAVSRPALEIQPPLQPAASNQWNDVSNDWKPEPIKIQSLKGLKQASGLLTSSHGLKMPAGNPFRIASKTGKPGIDLKEPGNLKRAMLSHIVFSPPRAYDLSFDNTIAQ
ncbi:MAG: hypothetical protein K9M45_09365 [Kiritimatiellales bacterium]|nr:hypothetical protein [Kiritimatiellales bacterium]